MEKTLLLKTKTQIGKLETGEIKERSRRSVWVPGKKFVTTYQSVIKEEERKRERRSRDRCERTKK